MTYREQLKIIDALEIDINELIIADECDYIFEFDTTDEEFDNIVKFAYNVFLVTDIKQLTPNDIAAYINCLIIDIGKTIEEVIAMNEHVFATEAIAYING